MSLTHINGSTDSHWHRGKEDASILDSTLTFCDMTWGNVCHSTGIRSRTVGRASLRVQQRTKAHLPVTTAVEANCVWTVVATAPCAGSRGRWWGCHALSDLVKAQRAAHNQFRSDLQPTTHHDCRKNPASLSQGSWLVTSACTLTQRLVKIQHL